MCFGGEIFDTFPQGCSAHSFELKVTHFQWKLTTAERIISLLNGSLQIVTRNIRCSTLVQVI